MDIKYTKGWTTHMPMLIKTVQMCKGDVVEVGGGIFSTPLLHWLCKDLKKNLITYENEPTFYKMAHEFQSPLHRIRWIDNWDDMDFVTHRGVVFIDHHPSERRGIDAINFMMSADYIVLHDSEKPEKHSYDKAWGYFKYIYHWKDCKPYTSVVSNFKDLSNL